VSEELITNDLQVNQETNHGETDNKIT